MLKRIQIKNFGPIEDADIEIAPMTIFVGASNTGKSYATILIYAINRALREFSLGLNYLLHRYEGLVEKQLVDDDSGSPIALLEDLSRVCRHNVPNSTVEYSFPSTFAKRLRVIAEEVSNLVSVELAWILQNHISYAFSSRITNLIRHGMNKGESASLKLWVGNDCATSKPLLSVSVLSTASATAQGLLPTDEPEPRFQLENKIDLFSDRDDSRSPSTQLSITDIRSLLDAVYRAFRTRLDMPLRLSRRIRRPRGLTLFQVEPENDWQVLASQVEEIVTELSRQEEVPSFKIEALLKHEMYYWGVRHLFQRLPLQGQSFRDQMLEDLSGAERFSECLYFPASRSGLLQTHKAFSAAMVQKAAIGGFGLQAQEVPPVSGALADYIASILNLSSINQDSAGSQIGGMSAPRLEKLAERLKARSAKLIAPHLNALHEKVMKGRVEMMPISFGPSGGPMRASMSGYPEIVYMQFDDQGKLLPALPMHRVSSMVGELAPFALLLQQRIGIGDTIVLEEPESHLHPHAQLELANVLFGLSTCGVLTILTSHSDFFVNETALTARTLMLGELKIEFHDRINSKQSGGSPWSVGKTVEFADLRLGSRIAVYEFASSTGRGSIAERAPIKFVEGFKGGSFQSPVQEYTDRLMKLSSGIRDFLRTGFRPQISSKSGTLESTST